MAVLYKTASSYLHKIFIIFIIKKVEIIDIMNTPHLILHVIECLVATKPLPQVVPVATMPVQKIITFPLGCSKDVMVWLRRVLGNHPSLTLLNISCNLSWSFHSKGATFKYEGYTYFHNNPHYVMWIAIQCSLK